MLSLLGTLNRVSAQNLSITHIRIGPDGRIVLQHTADTNSYYILLRGDQVTAILTAKDMQFGAVGTNQLKDPNLATNAGFYRMRQVPLSSPLDTDGDGLDDVCELKYRPLLDPINPNDANLDPDGDGRTTLEECAANRNPFVADLPEVTTISYPTNATTASFVIFSGVATTNTLIRVDGGAAYVTNAVGAGGAFDVTVALNPNRLNRLFVSSVDEYGNVSAPVPIDILQDSVAPYLFIDFPTNGAVLTTSNTLVAGRVGDALSGFMGLSVTVNGVAANVDVGIGPNGTYQRGGVPLNVGTNQLTVMASDRLGNSITKNVTVVREEPAGPRLLAVSGDLQQTNILRRLAEPLVVKVTEAGGSPRANQLVNLQVTRSDGRLLPVNTNQIAADITTRPDYSSNGTMFLQLFTDANGEARAWWTMGMDAGHANNRVTVSASNIQETVYFCASGTALPAKQINIGSGNNQRGETLGHAAEPLKVWVSDGSNPVAGVPVTFRVAQGSGELVPIVDVDGASPAGPGLRGSRPTGSIALKRKIRKDALASEVTVLTSITGHAEVDFIFGPESGNQMVEATFIGNAGLPATFTTRALARVPGQPTSFSGLIQDNAMQPIGRAWCELTVAGATLQTFSDGQGHFAFANIPSGAGHLYVNGGTAITLGTNSIPSNSFPALQYTIAVVPNAENSLPTPVLLPRLNTNNAKWYYGTNDLVVTCEGIAGLKMTIKANSMKHPGGEIVSPGRPAFVSLNQVHHDNIPMPMPDGASPPFAWTLQPGGATFDPPVQVEYPNMSGLAPGAAAFFLTFNHDTERFEIVASGHVIEDGSKIVCDPNAGLAISGWGCNCPPYSVVGSCTNECKTCPSALTIKPIDPNDAETLALENNPVKWTALNAAVQANLDSLRQRFDVLVCLAPQLENQEDSVYRTQAYQNHLINVKKAWKASTNPNLSPECKRKCAPELARLNQECRHGVCNDNQIATSKPEHVAGNAFDIPARRVGGLTESQIRSLANQAGLQVLREPANIQIPVRTYHFTPIAGPPVACWRLGLPGFAPAQILNDDAEEVVESGDTAAVIDAEQWSLVVNGQTINVPFAEEFSLPNISAPDQFGLGGPGTARDFLGDDFVRLTGASTKDGVTRYVLSEFIQIRQGATVSITNLTFTDIPPRKPESLTIVPQFTVMTQVLQTNQLRVVAKYADASTNDVALKTSWTSYRISNPNIATVDANGVVTAKMRGMVFVTAVNEGASAVVQLDVSPGDQLTQVIGRVVDTNGVPVVGATVRIYDLAVLPVLTDANGNFVFTGVPTGFGALSISVKLNAGGRTFTASMRLPGVPGGQTVVGTLVVKPIEAQSNPRLAAGYTYTVAVRKDGTLWSWGNNAFGQLGDGTTVNKLTPQPIQSNVTWKAVAAGYSHTVALRDDGTLWTWGQNNYGQLGDGMTGDKLVPQPLQTNVMWKAVAAGYSHTVALRGNGTLWAWGRNDYGQVGDGTTAGKLVPQPIQTNVTWKAVAAGNYFTVALREDGTLWAWGSNADGQLGDGTTASKLTPQPIQSNATWKAVAAGSAHTVALRDDGTLWTWGQNTYGQVGDGTRIGKVTPQPIQTNVTWKTVAAGYFQTVALRDDGMLWTWGHNYQGQTGDETRFDDKVTPQPIQTTVLWKDVAAGGGHTVALREDATLWAWGNNLGGQLGDGGETKVTPQPIQTNVTWKAVAGGYNHTVALRENATLWTWGDNSSGQLGDGGSFNVTPQPIQPNVTWKAVAARYFHTVALREDGTLWTWGYNSYGQLGDGTTEEKFTPQPIQSNVIWKAVAAGAEYTVALREDGKLWAWGYNEPGTLGDGTTLRKLTPQPIQSNVTWKAVAAGEWHTVALHTNGTRWAWGNNGFGQFGDGTRVHGLTPRPIQTNVTWKAVSAGNYHTVALREDGTLWTWGGNYYGQLGDGTTADKLTPQPIQTNVTWKAVAAGDFHTVALRANGTLWAWGYNLNGQVGDGTTVDKLTPQPIQTNMAWKAVAAGFMHTVALREDGTLWAWGSNGYGQLGLSSARQVLGGAVWGPPP